METQALRGNQARHFIPPSTQRPRGRNASQASLLIEAYKAAKTAAAKAERTYRRLCAKHPELEDSRALVPMGKKNGGTVYGRCQGEFEEQFPGRSPEVRKLHKAFLAAKKAAAPAHDKSRRKAGITQAHFAAYTAMCAKHRAFRQVCILEPRSLIDAAEVAQFLLKELPERLEGRVLGRTYSMTDYEEMKDRRFDACGWMGQALRSLAKTRSRG